jgi:diaminopimelate epimerase
MKELEFYKMSASGNDFIIIDNRDGIMGERFPDLSAFTVKVCRRNHSVGADGLILIENGENVDFAWRFFNADGSEAEMCGNGGRCAARYCFLRGIAPETMTFQTLAGTIKAHVMGANVKLQLTDPHELKLDHPVQIDDKEIFLSSVNTGVPHAVVIVDDVDRLHVEELGRTIRFHKAFGEKGSNVDFVQIADSSRIRIRTYERGVEGETYACGTGAVAAAVVLNKKGLVKNPVDVVTRGGETLKVHLGDEVYLEGDTRIIYMAVLHEEALR